VIIVLCFGMAFGAGLTAGKLWERSAHAVAPDPAIVTPPAAAIAPTLPENKDHWLAPLKMTPEQNEKMRAIWSEVGKFSPVRHKQGETLRKKRDEDLKGLMTEEQRIKYTQINMKYERSTGEEWRRSQMTQERLRRERDEAQKNVLSEEQKKLSKEIEKSYQQSLEDSAKDSKKDFDTALEKTRQLLTAEQWQKYEEIRKQHMHDPHRQGPRGEMPRGEGPRGEGPRRFGNGGGNDSK
jgi:hypothetical protein